MSRSPYRRNNFNQRKEISPYKPEPTKLSEKSRLGYSYIADQPTPQRRGFPLEDSLGHQYTQKRTHGKVDTLLQQNKYLLAENNQLSTIINDRTKLIMALQRKLEQQIAQQVHTLEEIEGEKNRFLGEYSRKVEEHNRKNEQLLNEISQLHEDIYELENFKNKQIQETKEKYTKEHKMQLQSILTNHAQTIELMQLESTKLKEVIHEKDQLYENETLEHKSMAQKLMNKIKTLQKQIDHVQHVKKLEISDQKIKYENMIDKIKREFQKQSQISTLQYDNEIKRLKNEVTVRDAEVEKLNNDLVTSHIQTQMKINELQEHKSQLVNEKSQLEDFQKTLISDQKQKIKTLTQMEIDNLETTNGHIVEGFKKQIQRLTQLNETKANEVMKLYVQLQTVRNKHRDEIERNRREIEELKELINDEKTNEYQELECFKTKMAHLRHADLNSMKNYYENELATLLLDLDQKEKIIQENRGKLHHQIEDKTEMRKGFDIEVAKLMVRIGDLELKLANAVKEKKEELNNLGSQMELTSMTLLRANEGKEKYSIFSSEEKKKLQTMIEDKDKEIENLIAKIEMIKANNDKELKEKNEEINILKKSREEIDLTLKKQKCFLENQIKRKEGHHKNDKEFYESEIARLKRQASNQYGTLLEKSTKERNQLEDQLAQLKTSLKDANAELAMIKEQKEEQMINNDIVISQEKERMSSMKDIMEINLNNYYKKQLESKSEEIKDLRQQLKEKNEDIRMHCEKEKNLEEKIEKLIEGEEKLGRMEEKVINIGQQNNLVKNISELVKSRKK